MLAAHADQENLVASHQAAAQAKPLNHGSTIKPFAPKTPLRLPLNDENVTKKTSKTAKKGHDNAFVTPAGPRSRAPLGMKTTNAKARAFATPALQTAEPGSERTGVKSSGPRLRRAKVKVHQATPVKDPTADEERDIEYMPPRGVPLNDDPEDWPPLNLSMLEGSNLTRGVYLNYLNPIGEDGLTHSERRDKELFAKIDQRNDELMVKSLEETLGPFTDAERQAFGMPLKTIRKPKDQDTRPASAASNKSAQSSSRRPASAIGRPASAASTSRAPLPSSRAAVSALSHYSNPTASVRARSRSVLSDSTPSAPVVSRKRPAATSMAAPKPSDPYAVRHQAATAASKTTLGYGKGRAVSSSIRKPIPSIFGHQRAVSQPAAKVNKTDSTSSANGAAPTGARPSVPTFGRSRSAWSRHDSDVTLTPSMADSQDEQEPDVELELMRELHSQTMNTELDDCDWIKSGSNTDALDFALDDEEEEFQFTIPELPEPEP
ncbi:uncharacterized protein K452DRAFT_318653 [Aplosporella prunicola CBS 121167]|uniref:Uncharacterized protein n=1 Tax=Aplosporella prunicola CBS 121167 TaxID=1176127 RepID=A0A6A6BBX0_9PEZI|nr:uncharacterized protein K452DRAFT_318653 [Aplosporella prunicola CBS 121167]KAF2141699.1 hypothetical protein K452DRAFT_318653 [Aplosporella prunicola CBS 121167]